MKEIVLYALLSIIALCLIAIVYCFFKIAKENKKETQAPVITDYKKPNKNIMVTASSSIPDDVVFDNKNLPYRTSRSKSKRINYGKDFNAYLVKGGTIYHKKSCKKLKGKKVAIKHIYECISDKNKKACPYCNPRTDVHGWYVAKFPDSVFVQKKTESVAMQAEAPLSLYDYEEN